MTANSGVVKMQVSKDEKNLVISFIRFMRPKINQGSEEQKLNMEMTIAWLEEAFSIGDMDYAFEASKSLLDVFVAEEGHLKANEHVTPTDAEIEKANVLKEEGNELAKSGKLEVAVNKYSEAIRLHRDPIFFCNRAAVYCRLEQFELAIQDCRTALALDPKYAKAYGRLGIAFSGQNHFEQAMDSYKKALEIDPVNETYKQNLEIAIEKKRELEQATSKPASEDIISGLLNNPQMQGMYSQMMSDPSIQNVMGQMMGSLGADAGGGMNELLRVGQMMAQQMSESNPELINQLRNVMGGAGSMGGQFQQGGGNDESDDASGEN